MAAQFESSSAPKAVRGSRALTVAGLCFADLFAGLFFVLLAGFGLVLAAAALCFAALASASGEAALPSLAINPQFSAKARRRLRAAALISLALFAACFLLSYVVCALSAGSFQFWHVWGWFRN